MTTTKGPIQKLVSKVLHHPLSRRRFIEASGATAGAVGAARLLQPRSAEAANDIGVPDMLETDANVDVRYTVCLGCHSKCGIRVRVANGEILKVDGNPWHPNCAETGTRLRFEDTLATGDVAAGSVCPKGQAGVEVMYNPVRIQQPLRRVGARGSGRWQAISWDVALTEIADRLRPYYDGYASDTYINGQSALGTIANQVVFSPGRLQHGQKEFTDRLFKLGFGTANNRHDHTSICETTHHVAGDFIAEKKKHHFKPDTLHAEYILWFGTNPVEANFPAPALAKRMVESKITGTKHVIIDPRHSRSAAFAHRWLPVKVGGDTALAMGITHRILSQGTYDGDFLEAVNNQAGLATINSGGATKDAQYNTTDASWLSVVQATDPADMGLFYRVAGDRMFADATSGVRTAVDLDSAAAAQYGRLELDGSEADAVTAVSVGLSDVGTYVLDVGGGTYVAPVFQLYKGRVFANTLSWYAQMSGITAATITTVADEFAAAGHKAVATAYRGACQHTNGMAAMQAILALNHLVGNWDWKGGNAAATGGHLHEMGGSAAGQLSLKSEAVTSRSPSGPQLTRVKTFYDSTLAAALGESFTEQSKRPWFPWAYNGNYQEILPSMEDQYPYAVGALLSYWNNIPYSTPAAKEASYRVLTDETIVPLHVNFDIEMSEMAALADYILPDGSYFERWSTPHNSPTLMSKYSSFRSPVVGYYANKVGTNGKTYWQSLNDGDLHTWGYTIDWTTETGPFALEDITIELMKRIGGGNLDGVGGLGANAYYASQGDLDAAVSPSHTNSLQTAWDWYWNILVNFAIEAGADPNDAGAIQTLAHAIVERGGWFQDTTDAGGAQINEYDGDYLKNRMKLGTASKALHFWFEYAYPSGHPDQPGKRYLDPYSRKPYDPLPAVRGVEDSLGNVVDDGPAYPFTLVTYKQMWQSQGRTDSLPSLNAIEPENFLEMNVADARRAGVWSGDIVTITSMSDPIGLTGKVKVSERIRPGVVAIAHSRGRWENSARKHRIDGAPVGGEAYRGKGLASCPVMRLDPALRNVTLQEPIGGSACFYATKVKVEKV